jgi:hypothetical protein
MPPLAKGSRATRRRLFACLPFAPAAMKLLERPPGERRAPSQPACDGQPPTVEADPRAVLRRSRERRP